MMRRLREWYWRQQFVPGLAAIMLNPFFIARRELLRGLCDYMPRLHGRILDVGCGRKPYREFVLAEEYIGVDVDSPVTRGLGVADVLYDGKVLPFADASFDGALCSQVLEHVFEPEAFLAELRRVLRPGGVVVLATPFAWDEHEPPHDFARYSSFGLKALVNRAGFDVDGQTKTAVGFVTLVQLASAHVFKVTRSGSRVVNLLSQILLIAPINMIGVVVAAVLPRNADLYLDNIILARKPR